MDEPRDVNPIVRDLVDKLHPVLVRVMDQLRPDLDKLAEVYIKKLPWYKRGIVRMTWWTILMIVITRIADAIIEALFAVRGDIDVSECSEPVRLALAGADAPPDPDPDLDPEGRP